MPYKDPEIRKLIHRNSARDSVHWNWRQIFIDCGGVCNYVDPETGLCGSIEQLEFHEQFGEDHKNEGRMQQRVLMCSPHHNHMHPERYHVEDNPHKSLLFEDIQADIKRLGGSEAWAKRYDVDLSRNGILLPHDNQSATSHVEGK